MLGESHSVVKACFNELLTSSFTINPNGIAVSISNLSALKDVITNYSFEYIEEITQPLNISHDYKQTEKSLRFLFLDKVSLKTLDTIIFEDAALNKRTFFIHRMGKRKGND